MDVRRTISIGSCDKYVFANEAIKIMVIHCTNRLERVRRYLLSVFSPRSVHRCQWNWVTTARLLQRNCYMTDSGLLTFHHVDVSRKEVACRSWGRGAAIICELKSKTHFPCWERGRGSLQKETERKKMLFFNIQRYFIYKDYINRSVDLWSRWDTWYEIRKHTAKCKIDYFDDKHAYPCMDNSRNLFAPSTYLRNLIRA